MTTRKCRHYREGASSAAGFCLAKWGRLQGVTRTAPSQKRARALLPGNELVMTKELIANMLGVRREGLTAVGLIRYARGTNNDYITLRH
jgi:hypothetical protein